MANRTTSSSVAIEMQTHQLGEEGTVHPSPPLPGQHADGDGHVRVRLRRVVVAAEAGAEADEAATGRIDAGPAGHTVAADAYGTSEPHKKLRPGGKQLLHRIAAAAAE